MLSREQRKCIALELLYDAVEMWEICRRLDDVDVPGSTEEHMESIHALISAFNLVKVIVEENS